jgi:hypothetical protein
MTWHSIDKRSAFDDYIESLDIRGKRESGLHDALVPMRRFVHDDVKDMNDKKAKLKEKAELQNKLEIARKSYETGRKSGRLAAQSEQELIDLQHDIEKMEEAIATGNVTKQYDFESETGLTMLREFDAQEQNHRRISRRESKKKRREEDAASVDRMPCSRLWPTGAIDGTGTVGLIVDQLMEVEKRMEDLVNWEKGDRAAWRSSVEKAVESWNESTIPNLADGSSNAQDGGPKCLTVFQILSMLKVCSLPGLLFCSTPSCCMPRSDS